MIDDLSPRRTLVQCRAGDYITRQSIIEFSYQRKEAEMLQAKQGPTKRKRRRKTLPVLGAAGLSLSLAGATTAAAIGGPATDMLTRNAGVSHEINLSEEEIADVSLATFYVVDTEGAAPSGRGARLAMGCGGCGGCGGCSSNSDYQAPTTWSNAGTLSVNPTRKAVRAPKRTSGQPYR
jgi:hypothetical protein